MRFSIRYQLLLPILAMMLGLVGASTWSAWSSGQRARRQIEAQIDNIVAAVGAVRFPLNTKILGLMKGMSSAEFVVCDADGRPIRDADGQPIATLPDVPDDWPAPSTEPTGHFDLPVTIKNTSYLGGGLLLGPGARPGIVLYVLYPESLLREAAWRSVRPALALGVGGGLASILLSVLLARSLGARIEELDRRTRLIAHGDFSPMPLPSRDDELRDLGQSVNEMAQRLAQFQETITHTERLRLLGQVSGGLAHQLRNGVTGARLAVQLHAQDCPAIQDHDSLAVALRQLALVEMHLKRFLDVGKTIELQRRPCRLDVLVHDALDLLGPQCRHAHIELRLVAPTPEEIELNADAAQLGQVLLNVLTNAIEAAGPSGWVEVRWGLGQAGENAFVEVRDSGPGPPPDVIARLFEPFVTGKREGVGLGLAVARQIVLAHGGVITWSREQDCTCFRLELPRGS